MSTDNSETTGSEIPAPSPAGVDPTSGAAPIPGPGGIPAAGVSFTQVSPGARKRVKLIGVLVGVLVVLVIAGVVAIKVMNSSRTPEAEVRKYLDLLAAGKGTEATEMVDPGVRNDQRVFLTDEAMASATSLLVVEDVVADKSGEDSNIAEVTATMTVDGQRFTHTFTVTADEAMMGLLNNWTITDSLAVPVSVNGERIDQFSVGSVSASVGQSGVASRSSSYFFYPGVYTFTPVAPNEYVEAYPATVSVRDAVRSTSIGSGNDDVTFVGTFTDKFKDEVNEMIRERINSCVPGQWSSSSRCPDAIGASSATSVVIKQLPAEFSTRRLTDRTLEGDMVFELTSATGTREVETTVIVEAEIDDQGMLTLTADGKPDVTLTFRY